MLRPLMVVQCLRLIPASCGCILPCANAGSAVVPRFSQFPFGSLRGTGGWLAAASMKQVLNCLVCNMGDQAPVFKVIALNCGHHGVRPR